MSTGCSHETLLHFGFQSSQHPWIQDRLTHVQLTTKWRTVRVDCDLSSPRTLLALQPGSEEVLSHLIRLTTSGEINFDLSIHLGRIQSDHFSVQHLSISTSQSTALQLHEIPWLQISRLQVQPLTVAILGTFRHQILLPIPRSPPAPSSSTLRKPFNSVRCFVSVRPHWMERQVRAHPSHLAGLSQSGSNTHELLLERTKI